MPILYDSVSKVPTGPFKLILEDFPWNFENWGLEERMSRGEKWGRAKGRSPYKCIPHDDALNLEYTHLAAKDSVRLSWVALPKLQHAMELIHNEKYKVRGTDRYDSVFTFRTVPFIWLKLNKNAYENYQKFTKRYEGIVFTEDIWQYLFTDLQAFFKGSGYYTRANIEMILLSVRGKGLPRLNKSVSQLIITPLKGHSQKPQELYPKIDRLFGDIQPKIELFARKENGPPDNWQATGLEFDGQTIADFIESCKPK